MKWLFLLLVVLRDAKSYYSFFALIANEFKSCRLLKKLENKCVFFKTNKLIIFS